MADSRKIFPGFSTVGLGKNGPAVIKLLNKQKRKEAAARKILKMQQDLENLKKAYHANAPPMPQKIRKPRSFNRILNVPKFAPKEHLEVVESLLERFLKKKLKEVVMDIGDNGKTVTLAGVMKVLKSGPKECCGCGSIEDICLEDVRIDEKMKKAHACVDCLESGNVEIE